MSSSLESCIGQPLHVSNIVFSFTVLPSRSLLTYLPEEAKCSNPSWRTLYTFTGLGRMGVPYTYIVSPKKGLVTVTNVPDKTHMRDATTTFIHAFQSVNNRSTVDVETSQFTIHSNSVKGQINFPIFPKAVVLAAVRQLEEEAKKQDQLTKNNEDKNTEMDMYDVMPSLPSRLVMVGYNPLYQHALKFTVTNQPGVMFLEPNGHFTISAVSGCFVARMLLRSVVTFLYKSVPSFSMAVKSAAKVDDGTSSSASENDSNEE